MPYALFQLLTDRRKDFIETHLFFVEQTKRRLLSQFDDLESEAKSAEEQWLADHASSFNPEHSDPSDYLERAYIHGVEVYQSLSELCEQAKLLLVAGMYHHWEKTFKEWLVKEIRHWHSGSDPKMAIWKANFEQLLDLWKHLGWDWTKEAFFQTLDSCRLITNVHKHGDGQALKALKETFPKYLVYPLAAQKISFTFHSELNHEHLRVTDSQIEEFSEAIVQFWQKVPMEIFDDDVKSIPNWFEKAVIKNELFGNIGANFKEDIL